MFRLYTFVRTSLVLIPHDNIAAGNGVVLSMSIPALAAFARRSEALLCMEPPAAWVHLRPLRLRSQCWRAGPADGTTQPAGVDLQTSAATSDRTAATDRLYQVQRAHTAPLVQRGQR